MAKIKYNSEIGTSICSNLKEASQTIKNEISSKIASDFSDLTGVGLFSSQINNIASAAKELSESYDSFASAISSANDAWVETVDESEKIAKEFEEKVDDKQGDTSGTGGTGGYGGSGGYSSRNNNNKDDSNVKDVDKGKKVKQGDIENLITKLDDKTIPILLQKINKLMDDEFSSKVLFDIDDSKILAIMLKKILGDTDEKIPTDMSPEEIQKKLLEKLNTSGLDLSTKEGKEEFDKYIKEQLKLNIDESEWFKLLYGDNTEKLDLSDLEDVGGTWVVAKTEQDLRSYATYVDESGISQDANTAKWGDKCLSFAETHTYDLYNNTKTEGNDAASYTRSGFKDYIDDDKQAVLSKVYDEIMSGRPVVLQVNGNTAGTSRHFVTVVGFKEGVVSGATIKESDLLIIDSWDGKIERMDTSKSRFMTSGAQCKKSYSGYRLRTIKA